MIKSSGYSSKNINFSKSSLNRNIDFSKDIATETKLSCKQGEGI